jgi:hypothetical protein
MTDEKELEYHKNYNPPCYRKIYYKTFQEIKKKAWAKLKDNFIIDLKGNPRKLITFLNNRRSIKKIEIEYKKIIIPKTKWKYTNQRIRQCIFLNKRMKITWNNQIHNFTKEIILKKSHIFFKFLGTSPYLSN